MITRTALDRVALVSIERPDKRNALNIAVCDAVRCAVTDAVSGGARALVITGSGSSFCSGADFGEVYTAEFRASLYAMLRSVVDARVPVVAAVNGPAIGAGTQLALAADLRVAAPGAVFGIPTAQLGLAVDPWTIRRLAELSGSGVARRLLLTCEQLPADGALGCGLAEQAGDLDAALALAHRLAVLAPLTMAYNKQVLNALADRPREDEDLLAAFDACWSSADLTEGRLAREEKRQPDFRGV